MNIKHLYLTESVSLGALQVSASNPTEVTVGSFLQPISAVTSTGLEFSLQNGKHPIQFKLLQI